MGIDNNLLDRPTLLLTKGLKRIISVPVTFIYTTPSNIMHLGVSYEIGHDCGLLTLCFTDEDA